jgi:hypothetical protein
MAVTVGAPSIAGHCNSRNALKEKKQAAGALKQQELCNRKAIVIAGML